MLSMSFDPHIIIYEPPMRFLVPKLTIYDDGMSDPFNHVMNFRQLITLNIGNDVLLYKVFLANSMIWPSSGSIGSFRTRLTLFEMSLRPLSATIYVLRAKRCQSLDSGFDVRRIMINPSSSTDLLHMSTYRQMGYSPSTLENPGRILIEFNEATTISLGNVVLPVQASPIIFNVYFLVIEDLSPYTCHYGTGMAP
uniref:Uncharacterized protein n=1 Tax=Vitis vinifera TaxID=29760 RepID=A5AHS7_VITVI|nr:hypothetical protein VITISV_010934 [Vitis vinifera]